MSPPFWFDRAIHSDSATASVEVDGAAIHYETWGQTGKPGLVLIHGSNAHREWWRFVAPFLAEHFRVAALDSSGNGDSGWRERYSGEVLAREVWRVCEDAGLGPRPFVAGHSFGGYVALQTGHHYGAQLGGIVFLDFTTAPPEEYVEWGLRAEREGVEPGRQTRVYADRETALARFRFIPEQPVKHPEVLRWVAERSLRPVPGGWTWKFDPSLFDHLEMGPRQRDQFAALPCRSAVMLGEDSEDEAAFYAEHMAQITGGKLPIFRIPGTHHHLMFDEPLAVAMALQALLLDWVREDAAEDIRSSLRAVLQRRRPC